MTAKRGFAPLRDLPAVVWLAAVVVVAVAQPSVPAPRWLMIHLLLLGGVTHSILMWSQHFADALLHTRPRGREAAQRTQRLLVLNVAVVLVVAGVVGDVWPVTAAGATGVALAAGWHAVALVQQLRRALPARFSATVHYYVAAASLLPLGAFFGVLMARGLGDPRHAEVMLAHVAVNVLGWMGLTVVGTLVTLWPTMLRTRIAEGSERLARRALPVLLAGVLVTAGGALGGWRPVAALGLAGYLLGLLMVAVPLLGAARHKAPAHYPTWSVLAGMLWLAGCVTALAVGIGAAPTWTAAHEHLEWFTPALAAGFGGQVLLGALSYLVPVALGGGPTPIRAANTALDRGGLLRIVLVNAGLVVCLLPVPSAVRVLCSVLVLGGLTAFLPLLFVAMRASRLAKADPAAARLAPRSGPARVAGERPRGQLAGLGATGLVAVVLAVAVGVAVDPAALEGARHAPALAAGVVASGEATRVTVNAANMRFSPESVRVPAGNHLVIELRNADDSEVHDLVLATGQDSGRLAPGESATIDAGVIGRDVEGWCSVVGHRQMGMVFHVRVEGRTSGPTRAGMPGMGGAQGTGAGAPGAAADLDFMKDPGRAFRARDASLPPVGPGRVHRRTFTVSEVEREVAPGVRQRLWTYNELAPGPILHGRVGDRFVVRLRNDGTLGHSVDFHAGTLAPDLPMRTIAPGQSLVYRFTADRSGIWLYHCASRPMSAHIASGMFGAVVIDPPRLPRADRSYVLVQSELYLGPQDGTVDLAKVRAERPDAVVFNGYADQYDHRPLRARVGERVRIWVLDAGPNRPSSFHVVGGQFDTVFSEGAYLLRAGNRQRGGAQVLSLGPAQGGFVELRFPEPGHYPFLTHVMVDAERGAHGVFRVTR